MNQAVNLLKLAAFLCS